MSDRCLICQEPGDIRFRALEVRTLPVRDLSGEKRVQALGDFVDVAICRSCAKKELELELAPLKASGKSNLRFGVVLLLGVLLIIGNLLFLKGGWIYTALGIAAVICGVLAIYENVKLARERQKELSSLPEDKALEKAAWNLALARLPKKEQNSSSRQDTRLKKRMVEHSDIDLTYIPITEETLARKNGDLMILYNLLPEIALEAHKRIHKTS
ncbi:MAG: hypothetical protein IIY45_13390 [Firmicutes bacterium]|nr:hypothetical protein [Bacillota bacterium]